ncbi:glycosyltransferase family protein [Egicoccus halophilus]|uniref:glycosyltransferase family protein n=1 Tax=Egicoccus halophilus TaxID=1670830 RepID=UPI0010307FCC|nr:glycosyltransferase [Egicoccus halophilus]
MDPQQTGARQAWLAANGGDGAVVLDDAGTAAGRLGDLGDEATTVVVLADVLDSLDDPGVVLAELRRVLAADGRVLVVHRVAGAGSAEPRRWSTPAALAYGLAEHLAPRELSLADGELRMIASTGPADRAVLDRLVAAVSDAAEQAWQDVAADLHRGREELRGMRERLEGLQPAIRGRSVAARDRGRLEQQLQELVDEAEQQLSTMAYERDEARHKLAALRARRWQRLGSLLAAARSSRSALLLLPWRLWQVLTGPPARPSLPPPTHRHVELTVDEELPVVTGMRPRAIDPVEPVAVADLRVAGILDTFTRACVAPEVDLVTFSPESWRDQLEQRPPHLLFVESAWQGNDGSWQYRIGQYDDVASIGHPDLAALTAWCRDRGVPTVFWNKEDPIHFDRFRRASTLFDVVLTTDAERVPEYTRLQLQSAEIVEALPFAAQPVLHHPTGGMGVRDPRPAFAGTYYKQRHEARKRSLEQLLDAARAFDLVIYSRTHGDGDPSTGFPERFDPYVVGGLPYDEMVRHYRRHRLFLNTNSVVSSPTMFSRRVFELLACGTPVVSTPSLGLSTMLGDVVDVVDDEEAAHAAIRRLAEDDDWWRRRSLAGLERVMSAHTYAHRLAQVGRWCGYDVAAHRDERMAVLRPSVATGVPVATDEGEQEVLLADDATGTAPGAAHRVALAGTDERARYRELADLAGAGWVLVGEGAPDPALVARLATARRYTRAEVLGVAVDGGPSHRYVTSVAVGPALVRRELVARIGWSSDPTVLAPLLAELRDEGARLYAVEAAAPGGTA